MPKEGSERMKNKKSFISLIFITFLLLAGSIALSLLRDDNPYRYFTGMGESFDLSPDDDQYLFSYYLDGKEDIYRSTIDGKQVEKLTKSESANFHSPRFSKDGTKILYLAQNAEKINTLYIANKNGDEEEKLTDDKTHVSEAVFSNTGEEIYFIATPAEDYLKVEGETTEGFDLFVLNLATKEIQQLTNQDHFMMENLALSQDGKTIYYTLFEMNREVVTAFSLEEGSEKDAPGSNKLPEESYYISYSPDESKLAYTTISEESFDSSLFKYELFLLDIESGKSKRLTNLESSIVSPKFFMSENKIAFLENTNWPLDPKKHTLHVMDLGKEEIQTVDITINLEKSSHFLSKIIDTFANGVTVAILYVILLCLISTYLASYHYKNRYYPAIFSVILSILVLISSFIVAATIDPWYGIGLGMIAAALFGCTLVVLLYSFALRFIVKRGTVA